MSLELVPIEVARQRRGRRQERLSTKGEIAAHFRVSERTVERWMRRGMPYEKPFAGGTVRFPPAACDDWFRGLR